MRRIDNLTGLRFFAALWVILYHVKSTDVGSHFEPVHLIAHGFLGVDIFFVLSGFILSLVYCPRMPERFDPAWFRRFLTRRFAKVYPVHLATLLAMMALSFAASRAGYNFQHSEVDNNRWTAVASALMVQAWGVTRELSWNLPSWSVSAEWFAYLVLFVPIARTMRRVPTRWVIAAAVFDWIGLLTYTQSRRAGDLAVVTTDGIVRIAAEFFCGYALFRLVEGRRVRHGDALVAGGVGMLGVVSFVPAAMFAVMPAIWMLLAGLYGGGRYSNRVFGNKAYVFVGNASYSIYMLQYFVQIGCNQVTRRLHHAPTLGMAICVAVGDMAVAVVAGCVCYWVFEEPVRERVVAWVDGVGRKRGVVAVAA